MFAPSQEDVRRFWCQVAAKVDANEAMDALETIAGMWLQEHPEYRADLADVDAALARMHDVDSGKTNPFLHLSMHLSITEQCSIDQPQGIRQAVELLTAKKDDLHEAHHLVMEELGRMLHDAQSAQRAPDGAAYVARVQERATR
jgi:Domain of unknown function (DUF1841)